MAAIALPRIEVRIAHIPHFQPQLNSTLGIIGAEALLRWRHPERGLMTPEHFIPVAEETGLILALGQQVLEVACSLLSAWRDDPRKKNLRLSIGALKTLGVRFSVDDFGTGHSSLSKLSQLPLDLRAARERWLTGATTLHYRRSATVRFFAASSARTHSRR